MIRNKIILIFSIIGLLLTQVSIASEYVLSICNEHSYVQHRGEKLYLPNKSEPYSGLSWCRTADQVDKSKGNYKDGLKEGLWETWYPNGRLTYSIEYKAGEFDGQRRHYYESGEKENRSYWKNGVRNGSHEEWYESSQRRNLENYKDGKQHGEFKDWYENGQVQFEGSHIDGEKSGEYNAWYENAGGVKSKQLFFEKGLMIGIGTFWHENGNKSFQCKYNLDMLDGRCQWWYESGKKEQIADYVMNNPEGVIRKWNESSIKTLDMDNSKSIRRGVWYWYNESLEDFEGDYDFIKLTDEMKSELKYTGQTVYPAELTKSKLKDLDFFQNADGEIRVLAIHDDSYVPKEAREIFKKTNFYKSKQLILNDPKQRPHTDEVYEN